MDSFKPHKQQRNDMQQNNYNNAHDFSTAVIFKYIIKVTSKTKCSLILTVF